MKVTTGVILAGGKATRMGRDKAFVLFRGAPMIDHVAAGVAAAGLRVLVVGREAPGHASALDLPDHGAGPAVGLLTALHRVPGDIFLVAVDQPLVRPETVRSLLEMPGDAVVPTAAGHPQVTCAVYRAGCRTPLEQAIGSGERKLRNLLELVDTTFVPESTWSKWGEDGRSWLSLDTPRAVREAETLR